MSQRKVVLTVHGGSFLGSSPHSDNRSQPGKLRAERHEPSLTSLRAVLPVVGLLVLILSGCSNAKTASKDTFTRAIQTFEQAHPEQTKVCTYVNTGVINSSALYDAEDVQTDASFAQLKELKRLGYLTMKDARAPFGRPGIQVDITPKYTQLFGDPSESSSSDSACVGTFSLASVEDFTAPADMMGNTISQVDATVKQTVTAEWTKDANLTRLVKYEVPAATRKRQYIMVLKDSGWVVSSVR